MDYGTLKTLLASYLHRDDLTATIPTFITLAQARLNHDIDLMSMHTTASLAVVASVKEIALPTDFLEMLSVRVPYEGGFRVVEQRSLAQNGQVFESQLGATGAPRYFARYGTTLEVSPLPEEATTLEIIYKQRLTPFVSDTDTDDMLTYNPNIYVYGAMLEAMPFLKDPNTKWQELYLGEVERLNEQNDDQQWSGGPIQIFNLGTDTP
jgi:hypothetical protein